MFTAILRALSLLSISGDHWRTTLNWYLNLFLYAGCTVREEFVNVVCMGALIVANLAGCTAPLSQPEASRRAEADPLIRPVKRSTRIGGVANAIVRFLQRSHLILSSSGSFPPILHFSLVGCFTSKSGNAVAGAALQLPLWAAVLT
jgi:hypothetical protein